MSKVFNKQFRFKVDVVKSEGDIDGDFYVEGYASTSDLDRQGDIILQEALQAAAKDLEEINNTVFYGHKYDLENAVGRLVNVTVDSVGLRTKIYVSKWAKELRTKLKEGIINKYSIGGRVLQDRQIPKNEALAQGIINEDVPFDQINLIESIELFEVSFVGVPANPNAQVVGTFAKALKGAYTKDEVTKEIKGIDNKDKRGAGMDKEVILEKARGDGQGNGGERQGDGGADTCVCPDCKKEVPHVKGTPCADTKCPDCGTPMIGKSLDEKVEEKKEEPKEEVAKEEPKEEVAKEEPKEEVAKEEPKEEVAKEEPEEEKVADIAKLLKDLTTSIAELSTFIKERVKTIEVSAEKKSIVKTKETEKKKEVDPDESFLAYIKGTTDKVE